MFRKPFTVFVDDNFHYMDQEHRYRHGAFATWDKAVAACQKLIDAELRDFLEQGIEPEALSATWALYGSDPFIVATDDGTAGPARRFSARDYVAKCVQKMAGE